MSYSPMMKYLCTACDLKVSVRYGFSTCPNCRKRGFLTDYADACRPSTIPISPRDAIQYLKDYMAEQTVVALASTKNKAIVVLINEVEKYINIREKVNERNKNNG